MELFQRFSLLILAVYAAYGGIFVVMAIIWGFLVDKKRPDKYEIIGGLVVLFGASIIFYAPR
ncbi:MAG TPA: hypothetical protein VIY08_14550 [Candidatus Nitrosocosmicus sp.]